jgi:hypothetical protein
MGGDSGIRCYGGIRNRWFAKHQALIASLGPSFEPTPCGPAGTPRPCHSRIKRASASCAFSPLRPPLPTTPIPPRSPQPVCIGFVSFFLIVLFILEPLTLFSFLPISLDVRKDFRLFLRPVPPSSFPRSFLYKPVTVGTERVNRIITFGLKSPPLQTSRLVSKAPGSLCPIRLFNCNIGTQKE